MGNLLISLLFLSQRQTVAPGADTNPQNGQRDCRERRPFYLYKQSNERDAQRQKERGTGKLMGELHQREIGDAEEGSVLHGELVPGKIKLVIEPQDPVGVQYLTKDIGVLGKIRRWYSAENIEPGVHEAVHFLPHGSAELLEERAQGRAARLPVLDGCCLRRASSVNGLSPQQLTEVPLA